MDGAVERGRRLQYATIAWNSAECGASLVTGALAGSIALVGFGLDSAVEVASSLTALWLLARHGDPRTHEATERRAAAIIGVCFLVLAAYVLYDALVTLVARRAPDATVSGIVVAALAVVAMPLLARWKRRVARELGSAALEAESRQSDICAYLSVLLLTALVLNALLGWWWADPVGAVIMVPIIGREGVTALRGDLCCDD